MIASPVGVLAVDNLRIKKRNQSIKPEMQGLESAVRRYEVLGWELSVRGPNGSAKKAVLRDADF